MHRSAAGSLLSTTRLVGQTLAASLVAILLSMGDGEGAVPGLIAGAMTLIAGMLTAARLGLIASVRPRL
jgi:DHA2 family multidrug resistance protein-like MFS transporter